MSVTREQALALARSARTADEVERAMMALAALPTDAEVEVAQAALGAALDQATRGSGVRDAFEAGRMRDIELNPGADNS